MAILCNFSPSFVVSLLFAFSISLDAQNSWSDVGEYDVFVYCYFLLICRKVDLQFKGN